ncbi:MAG: GNAT family N-acetyltransferase [Egibacteraceae bacterium]
MSAAPSLTALAWDVCPPPAPGCRPVWLDEVEAFRGRVLYDSGRRPGFLAGDGRCVDPDPGDRDAYHVIASSDDGIVGCFRVIALATAHSGVCEGLLGTQRLEDVLRALGTDRGRVSEGGGWAVDPGYRGQGLGLRLLATGVAVAERLGLTTMLGASGVSDGQCRTLAKVGGRPVPGIDLVGVPRLADDIRIMYTSAAAATPRFRALVNEAGIEMGLRLG